MTEVSINGPTPRDSCQSKPPHQLLEMLADQWGCDVMSEDMATRLDQADELSHLRDEFFIPKQGTLPKIDPALIADPEDDAVYLCGQSLGLQPKANLSFIKRELDKWAQMGVLGHMEGHMPWAACDKVVDSYSAELVGALRDEVAIMNGLTVNQHLLLISFYQPTPDRHKILLEHHAFPSDHYTIESHIKLHGYNPETSMICLKPREGEHTLRHEDILSVIDKEGDSIAAVCLPGVQYYTGQLFDMPAITKAAHAKGCYVGFDLAHAVGNVEIALHDWDVDFACWCTYKYLNSGAGCIAGFFIHERHAHNDFPKLIGWWGHKAETRFDMDNKLELIPGAGGYRISNPPPMLCCSLEASLEVFKKTSIAELRKKSKLLTGYLEFLLLRQYPKTSRDGEMKSTYVEIITPSDPDQRGCQLSAMFSLPINRVFQELEKRAVVLDKREPNVLRIAPAPLYNSFTDVYKFVVRLGQAMQAAEFI